MRKGGVGLLTEGPVIRPTRTPQTENQLDHATPVLESWLDDPQGRIFLLSFTSLIFDSLTTPPQERLREMLRHDSAFWFPGKELPSG
jgi:hypothetical protein